MYRHAIIIALAIAVVLLAASSAIALGPYFNYSGRILASDGTAVPDGSYKLTFALYDTGAAGKQAWTETQAVTTADGVYSVVLGAVNPIAPMEANHPVYLAIANQTEDVTKVERAQIVFLVPDGIRTENIKDQAVTSAKLADGVGMMFVYNDFSDNQTTTIGSEVVLKTYTMPAKTLKKGMLVMVTGEAFAFNGGLVLYVNGRAIKSTVMQSQLDSLIRCGLGGINARLTKQDWDKPITIEVRGIVTANVGELVTPQSVTCTGLTIMGD